MPLYCLLWQELKQKKRDEFKHIAIFPCKLRVLTEHIFNTRDPIVIGVAVEAGIVKEGSPICVPSKEVGNVFIWEDRYSYTVLQFSWPSFIVYIVCCSLLTSELWRELRQTINLQRKQQKEWRFASKLNQFLEKHPRCMVVILIIQIYLLVRWAGIAVNQQRLLNVYIHQHNKLIVHLFKWNT